MAITLEAIYRYPLKGARGEALAEAQLAPGAGLAHDRRFALARADSKLDAAAPRWLPKQRFVMLMRDANLAPLACRLVAADEIELAAPGREPCRAPGDGEAGRQLLTDYANQFLGARREGAARLVEAGDLSFTDVPQNCLSILNLASVRDLEQRMGVSLGADRFRANLLLAGAPAWSEFDWVGREIRIGAATLRVPARIPRCAATGVDPASGRRDANVLKEMRRLYGHYDMGIYGEVVRGGRIAPGDAVAAPADAAARSWLSHWLRFFAFVGRAVPLALRSRRNASRRDD